MLEGVGEGLLAPATDAACQLHVLWHDGHTAQQTQQTWQGHECGSIPKKCHYCNAGGRPFNVHGVQPWWLLCLLFVEGTACPARLNLFRRLPFHDSGMQSMHFFTI